MFVGFFSAPECLRSSANMLALQRLKLQHSSERNMAGRSNLNRTWVYSGKNPARTAGSQFYS